jgi:PilZ domain
MTESGRERRRHERFSLGLPVCVQLEEREHALLVELLDISQSGARFVAPVGDVRVADHVAFGFVMPDRLSCQAKGRVVRVDDAGQFVLSLDDSNDAFAGFIRLLEANN